MDAILKSIFLHQSYQTFTIIKSEIQLVAKIYVRFSKISKFKITNKILESPILGEKSIEYKGIIIPVLLIVDSAFRLSESMMNPYPFRENTNTIEGKFNYTLLKCRKVVGAFLSFQTTICIQVSIAIFTAIS